MRSPLQGLREPYRLRSNTIYFTDWRYIYAGAQSWQTADGRGAPLWATEDPGTVIYRPHDLPRGIRLAAQQAKTVGPLLSPDKPWERIVSWSNLLYDEGRYRLWYECVPPADFVTRKVIGQNNVLCYAESEDGFVWTKPSLGILGFEGDEQTNIVFGGELTGEVGFHGGGLFKDPSAPPEERYKLIYLGMATEDDFARYLRERPDEVDPYSLRNDIGMVFAVYGAVSPDGLHWKVMPGPIVIQHSDTKTTAYFDETLGKYVGYFRTWYLGRRCIGRAETEDFGRWPLPENIVFADASLDAGDHWYTNGRTILPGTADYHLMFPSLYRTSTDGTEVHVASSAEGMFWSFVPGGPVINTAPMGSWDGGCVFGATDMVALPDGRLALPYTGYKVPHKYPRSDVLGELGLGLWDRGRLAAAVAEGEGEFALMQLIPPGRHLKLNVRTKHAGYVLAEMADSKGHPLPGCSFSDADVIVGDHLAARVTWKGATATGYPLEEPILLRFRIRAAELFSVEFGKE